MTLNRRNRKLCWFGCSSHWFGEEQICGSGLRQRERWRKGPGEVEEGRARNPVRKALQRSSSTGSSGRALHSDDTSVPGRPPPSPCTIEPSSSEYSPHDILPPNINQNQPVSHARSSSPIAGKTRSKSPLKPTQSQDIRGSSVLRGRCQQQSFVDGPSSANSSSPNTSLSQQFNQLKNRVRSLSYVTRSNRPQSSRNYRQFKLTIDSFHASTASQQPSAVTDHSITSLISTSMLSSLVPEQLSRVAPPSSTTPKSIFSQSSTKHTQFKLTADSFYQQANVTQRSPSVLDHFFVESFNRNSTLNALPPSIASSQLIKRESTVELIVNRTRSQSSKKYTQQKLTLNDLFKRGRSQRSSSVADFSHVNQLFDHKSTCSLRSQAMNAAPVINFFSFLIVDKNSLFNKDAWLHLMSGMSGKSISSLTETKRFKSRGSLRILSRLNRNISFLNVPQINYFEIMNFITDLSC